MILFLTEGLVGRTAAQYSHRNIPILNNTDSKPTIFGEGVMSTGDYESHLTFTREIEGLVF
jgi:hypothetical protein